MGDLRIFVVDDHAIIRRGLKALIDAEPGMEVIGEAEDGLAACELVPVLQPDVVVMDVSMPKLSGSLATERLRRECPRVKCWL
jgi:YesN/AraC family two-component response regulator